MSSPASEWRQRYERFDRKLGLLLGGLVGFLIGFFEGLEDSLAEALQAGLIGAVMLGAAVALLGDKVLNWLFRLYVGR